MEVAEQNREGFLSGGVSRGRKWEKELGEEEAEGEGAERNRIHFAKKHKTQYMALPLQAPASGQQGWDPDRTAA